MDVQWKYILKISGDIGHYDVALNGLFKNILQRK
jgi:hypothetical protein